MGNRDRKVIIKFVPKNDIKIKGLADFIVDNLGNGNRAKQKHENCITSLIVKCDSQLLVNHVKGIRGKRKKYEEVHEYRARAYQRYQKLFNCSHTKES